MSHAPTSASAEPCAPGEATGPVIETHPGRPTLLGDLAIRRLLPARGRRLVGPWCFLDAFGPLRFEAGKPMDVPPHPHIGLQTVSWLLDGEVLHRDSLGCEAVCRPGTLNLMTAGRGIAHSEETPGIRGGRLEGVQLWVALPEAHRHVEPSFEHHAELPSLDLAGGRVAVLAGALCGRQAPGQFFSPIVGADVTAEPGRRIGLPLERSFEHAVLLLRGRGEVEGTALPPDTLLFLGRGRSSLSLVASGGPLRVLLIGGAPFGETVLMWWNFVARTPLEIGEARADWQAGRRFGEVEGYPGPRLAAPPFDARPAPPARSS